MLSIPSDKHLLSATFVSGNVFLGCVLIPNVVDLSFYCACVCFSNIYFIRKDSYNESIHGHAVAKSLGLRLVKLPQVEVFAQLRSIESQPQRWKGPP